MVIKNSYLYFYWGKALINFPGGFFESGIHYVPMGMAQGESIGKIMECAI